MSKLVALPPPKGNEEDALRLLAELEALIREHGCRSVALTVVTTDGQTYSNYVGGTLDLVGSIEIMKQVVLGELG